MLTASDSGELMFMPSRMFIYPIIPETGFVVMCVMRGDDAGVTGSPKSIASYGQLNSPFSSFSVLSSHL
ncbi:MFS efflux transporter aclA [Fusarium oxysporum f. sp. albedinis]|nr:MFS efflux transporter aclA [Fusarium oxysporum f. sp. albedinis]